MRFFLPMLFLMYWGGITLFAHSHVVNGVIMVHSHPFKAAHQHTQAEAAICCIFIVAYLKMKGNPFFAAKSEIFCDYSSKLPKIISKILQSMEKSVVYFSVLIW